jgi:hypothetical protein
VSRRRITALFTSSFVAFSLTTWLLTRTNFDGDGARGAGSPEGVVRMQLDALARGETQVAYALFSPRYRAEVSLDAFREVVATHGEMFHAKSIAIEEVSSSFSREEMRVRIAAADGQRYVARYTAVFIDGRWWIDAMRWHADEESPERVFTRAFDEDAPSNFRVGRRDSVRLGGRSIDTAGGGA